MKWDVFVDCQIKVGWKKTGRIFSDCCIKVAEVERHQSISSGNQQFILGDASYSYVADDFELRIPLKKTGKKNQIIIHSFKLVRS
jgi:hypothetical protein